MGPYLPVHVPDLCMGPYIPIYGCCDGSRIHLSVTADEWESLSYGHTPPRLAFQVAPSCGRWHVDERLDNYKRRLVKRGQFDTPPNDLSLWGFLSDTDSESTSMGVPTWKKSHLLSLPKELRLEIWRWTLTDPSVPELVVNIGRDKTKARRDSATGVVIPRVMTWLQPGRNCPINIGLLRTNRFIYEEALPLLYRSLRFAPADHQGIFPLFLDSLSPYARQLIRHVKLQIPRQIYDPDLFGAPTDSLFHWAITCAQIAKLEGQLRDVEIEGLWFGSQLINEKTKRSILNPLCKIKTKKVFGPNNDDDVERLLAHANWELARKANLRKTQAVLKALADDAAPKKRVEEGDTEEEMGNRTLGEPAGQPEHAVPETTYRYNSFLVTSDDTILHSLGTVAGIEVFEQELEEHTSSVLAEASSADDATTLAGDWDLIGYGSGASTPTDRPPSYMSRWSTDSWTDVASTIAEMHDPDKDEEVAK
jgi:hypothetical protein